MHQNASKCQPARERERERERRSKKERENECHPEAIIAGELLHDFLQKKRRNLALEKF